MPQPNPLNSAVARACAPRENLDAFVDNPITRAVRYEVSRFMTVSDTELAWIVEATLWHLRHLAEQNCEVDLDYLGHVRPTAVRLMNEPDNRPALLWITGGDNDVSADQEIAQ